MAAYFYIFYKKFIFENPLPLLVNFYGFIIFINVILSLSIFND